MPDDVWRRDEIQSPCVSVCVIHPEARICAGCMRTIDEIRDWSRLTDEDRARIVADLPTRAPLLKKRRGGRAVRLKQPD